jgi:hypothetical protein
VSSGGPLADSSTAGQHPTDREVGTTGEPAAAADGGAGEDEPPIDTSHWEPSSPDSRNFQLQYFHRILCREKGQKNPYADSTDDDEAPGLDCASGTAGEAGSVAVAARDCVVTAGTMPQPCKHAGEMRDGTVADATGGRSSSDSDVPGAESLVTAAGNGNFPCEPAGGGCGNSFISAIDSDGCRDALAAPPHSHCSGSFLSLLTDQHGICKFELNDAISVSVQCPSACRKYQRCTELGRCAGSLCLHPLDPLAQRAIRCFTSQGSGNSAVCNESPAKLIGSWALSESEWSESVPDG